MRYGTTGYRRVMVAVAIGSAAVLAAAGCNRPGHGQPTGPTAPTTATTTVPVGGDDHGVGEPGGDDHGGAPGGDDHGGGMDHGGGTPAPGGGHVDTGGAHHIPDRLNHPPTEEQKLAAQKLIDDAKASAAAHGWTDVKQAEADGFISIGDEMTGVAHHANLRNHVDGRNLDKDFPEVLVFKVNPDGSKTLETFMYVAEPDVNMDNVPDIAGNLTVWHAHDNLCYTTPTSGKLAGIAVDGICRPGGVLVPSQPMLHVWIIDNPCGPFAGVDPGNRTGSCSQM